MIDDPDLIDVGDRLELPAVTKKPAPTSSDRAHSEAGSTTRDSTTNDSPTEKSTDQDTGKQSAEPDATDHERVGENAPPVQHGPASTTPPQETAGPTPTTTSPAQSNPADALESRWRRRHSAAFSDTKLWAGAASALLAAGVVGLLAQRRRAQSITRRPGQRLAPMSAAAEEAVTALRQAEQPLTVAHLDRALRTLSAGVAAQDGELPLITAVRLDDDRLDLRLLQPHTNPPKPFTTSDGTVWTLTADRSELLLDAALANQVPAPYPALVTRRPRR